eukprot:TRINITY_DN1910_c0_g1_i1.p1 TRINITY_DN1910_c0_g1~~TRINITY_DN1910_c0_g1_i1.p1  ORF type:complete len:831 (+),score=237.18 TRINITY_DN1910_c0_g1_i1:133-2625(+)
MDSKRSCGRPGHTTTVICFCVTKECSPERLLCGRCVREHNPDHNIIFFDEFEETPDKLLGAFPIVRQDEILEITNDKRTSSEVSAETKEKLNVVIEEFLGKVRQHLHSLFDIAGKMTDDMLNERDEVTKSVQNLCDVQEMLELFYKDQRNGLQKFKQVLHEKVTQPIDKEELLKHAQEYINLKRVQEVLFKGDACRTAFDLMIKDYLSIEKIVTGEVTAEDSKSRIQRLGRQICYYAHSDEEEQQAYIKEVEACFDQIVENEEILLEVLGDISVAKSFSKDLRRQVGHWIDMLEKQKKPQKKKTSVQAAIEMEAKSAKPRLSRLQKLKDSGDGESAEKSAEKAPEESSETRDMVPEKSNSDIEVRIAKPREADLNKLCALCDRPRCTYYCKSHCKRAFHKECRRKVEEEGMICSLEENHITFDIEETRMSDAELKNSAETDYECKDCSSCIAYCFKCKKRGCYPPKEQSEEVERDELDDFIVEDEEESVKGSDEEDEEAVNSKEKPVKEDQKAPDEPGLMKCSTPNCHKFYHLECIEDDPLFKISGSRLRCSQHYCKVCGETKNTLPCLICPVSVHKKCADEEVRKIGKRNIICGRHKIVEEAIVQTVPSKLLQKRKNGEKSQSEKVKISSSAKENICPNVMADKRALSAMPKEKRVPSWALQELQKQPSDTNVNPNPCNEEMEEEEDEECILLSYDELGISPPTETDYQDETKPWCRYCGARYSSRFMDGPWGPETLCSQHHKETSKKALDLSPYPGLPWRPINSEVNSELRYLSKKRKSKSAEREEMLAAMEAGRKYLTALAMEEKEGTMSPRKRLQLEDDIEPEPVM